MSLHPRSPRTDFTRHDNGSDLQLGSPCTLAAQEQGAEGGVETPLLTPGDFRVEEEKNFIKALDQELARLIAFFMRKESELLSAFELLTLELHSVEGFGGPEAPAAAVEEGQVRLVGGGGKRNGHMLMVDGTGGATADCNAELHPTYYLWCSDLRHASSLRCQLWVALPRKLTHI